MKNTKQETERARHWADSVSLMYDVPTLVGSLYSLFKKMVPGKRLLDCSYGTGEITIRLKNMGFEIECTDGDQAMIDYAKSYTTQEINPHVVRWRDLLKYFQGNGKKTEFDIIMLRGNSLPYIVSWDNQEANFEIDREQVEKELYKSFNAIHGLLSSRGIFYFDTHSLFEKEGREVVGKGIIRDKKAELTFNISYKGYNRKIVSELQIGDDIETRVYNGYRIHPKKLDDLLQDAGFKFGNIRHDIPIKGEHVYSPWVVRK